MGVALCGLWAPSSKRSVCKGKFKKAEKESILSLKFSIEAV